MVKHACVPAKPLTYSSSQDTPDTVRQIRVLDKTGKLVGCWK